MYMCMYVYMYMKYVCVCMCGYVSNSFIVSHNIFMKTLDKDKLVKIL